MPFLGVQPTDQFASVAKQTITGTGATAYTLDHSVAGANDLAVFVNNVRQEPTVAYSATGTTITFTEALTSSDDCYIIYIARTFLAATPPYDLATDSTGFFALPTGTTAQRPANPAEGYIRKNTTINDREIYANNDWNQLKQAGRNLIINGAMQVAQRGTSVSVGASGGYSLDRFFVQSDIGSGHTFAQVSEAPDGSGLSYSAKLTVGTGATPSASNFGRLIYYVEGYDASRTEWGTSGAKALTLSFWVKSSVAGSMGGCIKLQAASPYAGYFFTYTINTANTWEYKTITVDSNIATAGSMNSTNGIGLLVAFDLGEGPDRSTTTGWNASNNGGTLGVTGATKILATSSATWQITGVQLEVGETATPFENRSFGEELTLCQRYCHVLNTENDRYNHIGTNYLSTHCYFKVQYPVVMRAAPSASQNTILASAYSAGGSVANYTSVTINNSFTLSSQVLISISGTAGYVSHVDLQGGQLTFDAEL